MLTRMDFRFTALGIRSGNGARFQLSGVGERPWGRREELRSSSSSTSVAVTMPTSRPRSTTGRQLIDFRRIRLAARRLSQAHEDLKRRMSTGAMPPMSVDLSSAPAIRLRYHPEPDSASSSDLRFCDCVRRNPSLVPTANHVASLRGALAAHPHCASGPELR